ncbi:hypothetical protein LR48_Vigan04g094800 [Vigna angularis]|uniref:Uncharacterized protein n=1 Tax=Phaseolus angularis TaxID=3914 RepID=A0A0L9UCU4_PHAAN|nr:hypothetical protein LR48_Vigan04g094800 [Vigna angularis]
MMRMGFVVEILRGKQRRWWKCVEQGANCGWRADACQAHTLDGGEVVIWRSEKLKMGNERMDGVIWKVAGENPLDSPALTFKGELVLESSLQKCNSIFSKDIAEHLTTVHLKRCSRGKRCLYEGSTSPGGFPNSWNGASYCTSELAIMKNNEMQTWDRGYDDDGNQVWGQKEGPYEFKPAPTSSFNDMFSPLNFPPPPSMERRIEGSFVLQE